MRFEALESRQLLAVVGPWSEAAASYPATHFVSRSGGYLSGPSADQPADIAQDYLSTHAAQFGLTAADLKDALVTDQYRTPSDGVTHVYLRQTFLGREVINANMIVNIAADGRVLSVGGGFAPHLAEQAKAATEDAAATFTISAAAALGDAAEALGMTVTSSATVIDQAATGGQADGGSLILVNEDFSQDPIPAELHYVALPGGLELAWHFVLRTPDGQHAYEVSVDAETGQPLLGIDRVWGYGESYNVYAQPTENPDDGPRSVVNDPADPVYSPYGWHDTDGAAGPEYTDTRGNNVDARSLDLLGNAVRPDGGAGLNFDFPVDLTQDPSTYRDAAITNLYYWINIAHDIFADYGFTEAAGNFQQTNYSGQGQGGDALVAYAQDLGGASTAFFIPAPEGFPAEMHMFVWDFTSPQRDGAFENQILVHEYAHGVTSRLVGGPSNVSVLQSPQGGSLGEGFSDFFALAFTQKPTDAKNDAYPTGNYVLGQPSTGSGIRQYPYSFDMSVDPLTLGNFTENPEVHAGGTIWASALWDLNWLLIDEYGFNPDIGVGYTGPGSAGNVLAMQLVMDSLSYLPAEPTFLNGRDAILQADQMLTGGANQDAIWTAFARRGMGASASDGGNPFAASVIQGFDLPWADPLVASHTPAAIVELSAGAVEVRFNQPMDPASFVPADDVVRFTGPGNADLKPQVTGFVWTDPQTLRIEFTPQAVVGTYTLVLGPDILAGDDGHAMDQNRDGTPGQAPEDEYALTFEVRDSIGPDGAGHVARPCPVEQLDLQRGEPGVQVAMDRQVFAQFGAIDLGSNTFTFYGRQYTGADQMYVTSGGLITFGNEPFFALNGDLSSLPDAAAIAPLWGPWSVFATDAAGVLYKVDGDRLIVEWSDVTNPDGDPLTFQAILQLNSGTNEGTIIFNYPNLDPGILDAGMPSSVGIKDAGIQGGNRLLVSARIAFDTPPSPFVGPGKAVSLATSAVISGRVYDDRDADRVFDAGDEAQAGITVYWDRDNDDQLDAGEIRTITDAQGQYAFRDLEPGSYVIREVLPAGYTHALPAAGEYAISLASAQQALGSDFANTKFPAPRVRHEPATTPNGRNTIRWHAVPGASQYYVEYAATPDFAQPLGNSGWIADRSYKFENLPLGVLYYHVKARKTAYEPTDSPWSQTSQADFQSDSLDRASAMETRGSVTLARSDQSVVIFSDGFESGSLDDWMPGFGPYTTEVTEATAAGGTHSLSLLGGVDVSTGVLAMDGPSRAFATVQPERIEFSFRTADAAKEGAAFAVRGNEGPELAIFMGADGNIHFVNDFLNPGVPYVANQWYQVSIEFDWSAKTASFSVNGVLISSAVPLLTGGDGLSRIDLWNIGNTQSWFDDISLTGAPFEPAGTVVSGPIARPAAAHWGTLNYRAATPAGTSLTVDVLDGQGNVLQSNVSAGADLNTLGITADTIQLRANLATSDVAATPLLEAWSVNWLEPYSLESQWSRAVSSRQVDTVAPRVTVDTLVTNVKEPTITGTITDADPSSGIADIKVLVHGMTIDATVDDGVWSATLPRALRDGVYNVVALAYDKAGNIGVDRTHHELTVDTAAPTVSLSRTPGQGEVTVDTTVRFRVVVSEPVADFTPPQQNSWVPGGVREGFDRRFSGISGQKEWFAIGWPKSDPDGATRRGQREILPAPAWLSLAGLLASRARLRFTRQNAV